MLSQIYTGTIHHRCPNLSPTHPLILPNLMIQGELNKKFFTCVSYASHYTQMICTIRLKQLLCDYIRCLQKTADELQLTQGRSRILETFFDLTGIFFK